MPSEENKKLYRSKENRIIAGVCGGLGEYFNVDPVLVRVAFILLAFVHGFGILLYIVLMIILPLEPEEGNGSKAAIKKEKPDNIAHETAGSNVFQGFVQEEPVKQEPEAPKIISAEEPSAGWPRSKRNFIGAVIIIIGLIIFLDNFLPIFSWISWKMVWAVAIILLGYLIIKN